MLTVVSELEIEVWMLMPRSQSSSINSLMVRYVADRDVCIQEEFISDCYGVKVKFLLVQILVMSCVLIVLAPYPPLQLLDLSV